MANNNLLPNTIAAYRQRAADLFNQGSTLYDAEPDMTQMEEFARRRGGQADSAMLNAMAASVYKLGDKAGAGSKVKIITQLLAGVHIAAAAEAFKTWSQVPIKERVQVFFRYKTIMEAHLMELAHGQEHLAGVGAGRYIGARVVGAS